MPTIILGKEPNNPVKLQTRESIGDYKGSRKAVSVIIPVYNAESVLAETLESVMRQSLHDIEIICVDDGSADKSAEMLQDFAGKDERFILIFHDENMGTGAAINSGLSIANGEFIQLLGNDDLLRDDALESLYAYCQESEIDMCLYGTEVFCDDPSDESLAQRVQDKARYHAVLNEYPVTSGVELLKLMVKNKEYRMTNGPIFTRSSLITEETYNIEGYRHEDMAYTYKLLVAAPKATLIPTQYYLYRVRNGSQEGVSYSSRESYPEIASKLVSAFEMLRFTPSELLEDDTFFPVVSHVINKHLRKASILFNSADKSVRRKITHSPDWRIRVYSAQLTRCLQVEDELVATKKELEAVKAEDESKKSAKAAPAKKLLSITSSVSKKIRKS